MMFVFLILMDGLLAIVPPQKKGTKMELPLLWRQPFCYPPYTGAQIWYVGPDGVLLAQHSELDVSDTLMMLDLNTGTCLWRWQDFYEHPTTLLKVGRQKPALAFPYLFMATGKGIFTLDLQNGKTMMQRHIAFSSSFQQIGRSVLCVQNQQDGRVAQIILVDMLKGAQTLEYQMQTDSTLRSEFDCPNWALETNGDTLLYWSYRRYHLLENQEETSLFAYNLTKKRLLYEKPAHTAAINPYAPVVTDSLIMLEGDHAVIGFQRNNGIERWRTPLSGKDWQQIQLIGRYLVLTDAENGHLLALDPSNGHLCWETDLSGACSLPQALDGILYLVNQENGRLYAVRLSDGVVIWSMESPDLCHDPYAGFSYGLGLDPQQHRLYVSSYLAAYCFQLAQP
jgi:outer membrane protein assembly factor BamB